MWYPMVMIIEDNFFIQHEIFFMIETMITAFQQPFFIRSLIVVVLLAMAFPLYGNIVVLRKEANIAHTFAHIALCGVAVWLWFDRPIHLSIVMSVGVTVVFLSLLSQQQEHVAHNEIWAQLGLVGAILVVSRMTWYQADISSYLFGDILLLWYQDVYIVALLVMLALWLYVVYGKKRYALSLHTSLAKSKGMHGRWLQILYLLGLGLLIWWAMKIIWVLLVSAFLVLPSNIWKHLATHKKQWNIMSIAVWCVSSVWALLLSWYFDTPSWAMIVASMICLFLLTSLWSILIKRMYH